MAAKKKRRRRKATARRSTRRRSVTANPRRRTARRRYRRNGPNFNVKSIVGRVQDGVMGAVAQVGGEASTRLIRGRVLGMPSGETLSSAAEILIATLLGIVGERVIGKQVARDVLVGGYAGVLRATAKQLGVPFVSEALSDDGPRLLRGGRSRLAGYVRPGLAGYVGPGNRAALGDETDKELGYTDD